MSDPNTATTPSTKMKNNKTANVATPSKKLPYRKAAESARKSIAYQSEMQRRRSMMPFHFDYSYDDATRAREIAESLSNISIGDFNKEINPSEQDDQENQPPPLPTNSEEENYITPDSDDENIPNENPHNLSNETFVIEQKFTETDEQKSTETTPTAPTKIPLRKVPLSENPFSSNFKKPSPAPGYLKNTFSYTTKKFSSGQRPSSSSRPRTPGSHTRFDLKASLQRKPSYKAHTGRIKPLNQTYTPEAQRNLAKLDKIEKSRSVSRVQQKQRQSLFREEKFGERRKGLATLDKSVEKDM